MIQKIIDNIYLGDDLAIDEIDGSWYVLHAAKEPYHRQMAGYTTRAAPSDDRYLVVSGDKSMALNLIDADSDRFIYKPMIDAAIAFIHTCLKNKQDILVHCNKGRSRSPTIVFLYLVSINYFRSSNFIDCVERFVQIYPKYCPRNGMFRFAQKHFNEYFCQGF